MPEPTFESFEARTKAENAAIDALFAFADAPPPRTSGAALFTERLVTMNKWLSLAIPGIARLQPETAKILYEIKRGPTSHTGVEWEFGGSQAYAIFVRRHDLFEEADFINRSVPKFSGSTPLLCIDIVDDWRIVSAGYAPDDYGRQRNAFIDTTFGDRYGSSFTSDTSSLSELYDHHGSFLFTDQGSNSTLTVFCADDTPLLNDQPATEQAMQPLLDDEARQSLQDGGFHALGSYLLWRSARDLREAAGLAQQI